MKRFQQPSKNYPAATNTFDLPPAATRRFTSLRAELTRENWPGQTTLLQAAGAADTVLTLASTSMPSTGRMNVVVDGSVLEVMQIVGRSGDLLTVERSEPIDLPVGAVLTVLDFVTIKFLRISDGKELAPATFPGGIARLRGVEQLTSFAHFTWVDPVTGAKVAQDGDVRVAITNLLAYRTAILLEMLEEGE